MLEPGGPEGHGLPQFFPSTLLLSRKYMYMHKCIPVNATSSMFMHVLMYIFLLIIIINHIHA